MPIGVTALAPENGAATVSGFNELWAYYVWGFKPEEHCQRCFQGRLSEHVNRAGMAVGETFVFDECQTFRQVYIS